MTRLSNRPRGVQLLSHDVAHVPGVSARPLGQGTGVISSLSDPQHPRQTITAALKITLHIHPNYLFTSQQWRPFKIVRSITSTSWTVR
jgi:hypothetical protein